MSTKNVRIEWVDVARGIAILLVVLGHCIGYLDDPGNRFILSFHMPLFFFISGFCVKQSSNEKCLEFIKKKCKTLLIPQFTLGIFNCIGAIVTQNWGGQ